VRVLDKPLSDRIKNHYTNLGYCVYKKPIKVSKCGGLYILKGEGLTAKRVYIEDLKLVRDFYRCTLTITDSLLVDLVHVEFCV